jgi:hypothetical protein
MTMTDTLQVPPGSTPPAGNTPPSDGNQQQQQQGAAPFWNELPENMRGPTAEETLKKVLPSWKGYHQAHTSREPALSKPEDLVLDIANEKAKPFFDAKSPMATAFAKAAVEAGLGKTQAGKLANAVMGQLAEGGHLAEQFDVKANVQSIARVLGHTEMNDAAKTAIQQFETESLAWAENTATQLKLSDTAKLELESLVLTPGGVEIIKALRAQTGQGFALGGQAATNMTKEQVLAMINDERYNSNSPKFDRAFRKQADEAYDALAKGSR